MSIQFKGSNVAGIKPAPGEIDERELAINTFDKKLYSKTSAGTIIEIGADNINTGLEEVTGNLSTDIGHRFINEPSANHGVIGNQATDLTVTDASGSYGATGIRSFSVGLNTTAVGLRSTVIGSLSSANNTDSISIGSINVVNGDNSIVIGNNSNTSGTNTFILGSNSSSDADDAVVIGIDNRITSALSTNSVLIGTGLDSSIQDDFIIGRYNIDLSGRAFTIGSGTSDVSRANIFEVLDNGVVISPLASTTDIDSQTKGLVTTEYLKSNTTPGVSSVNAETGDVVLVTGDIAELAGSEGSLDTHLWFTAAERNQVSLNATNISNLQTGKEPVLGNPGLDGYYLSSTAAGARSWVPNPVSSILIGDLSDVYPISTTTPNNPDAGRVLRVDPTGNDSQAGWYDLDRGILTSPIAEDTVPGFEYAVTPDTWDINTKTLAELNFKQNSLLAPLYPTIPVADDASYTPSSPSPVLIAVNLSGVDDGESPSRNTTFDMEWMDLGVGFTSDLLTTNKTSTVAAINEVRQSGINNATNIATNTTDIGTNTTDIGTNATNIATNTTDIGTNATNIATNTTDIGTNTTAIGSIASLSGINTGVNNLVLAVNNVESAVSNIKETNYISNTAAFTAVAEDYSFTDTSGGAFNITLPAGASGDTIYVLDVNTSFATNNATLVPDGTETIMGVNANYALTTDDKEYKIIYTGSDWRVI